MIVDNTTMQLVSKPQQFDVMVSNENDIQVDAQIMNPHAINELVHK